VRALRAERDGDSNPKIVGYASVFNEETDIAGLFSEVIRPGAFERAIEEEQDVRALVDHNPSLLLGRTKSGTLRMKEDEHGLRVEIDPPDTILAADTMELLARGDVDQMSFGFIVRSETWTKRDGQPELREITDVDLFDVSVVTFPAYEGTSVGLRSAEDIYNQHLDSDPDQTIEEERDEETEQTPDPSDFARPRAHEIEKERI
jgi:HK97 family phage prohead protease